MFEEFETLEEAQNRAREIYPNKTFPVTLGCVWKSNGYISLVEDKYRLYTDL